MDYLISSLSNTDVYNNVSVPAIIGKKIVNFSENSQYLSGILNVADSNELVAFAKRLEYLKTGDWLIRSISLCYVENSVIKAGILFSIPDSKLLFDYAYVRTDKDRELLPLLFHEAMVTILNYQNDFPPVISCEDSTIVRIFNEEMNGADEASESDEEGLDAYTYYVRLNTIKDGLDRFDLESSISFTPGYEPVLTVISDENEYAEFTYTGLSRAGESEVSMFLLDCRLYKNGELVKTDEHYEDPQFDDASLINDVILPFMYNI